ncbi:hypothetical protein ACFLT2_02275 [Acidobacteriota bacterium]
MKLKTLLVIKALVSLVFGIPILIVPDKLLALFGLTLNADGMFMAREYGGALIGIAALCWFARNSEGARALKAIILFGFYYDLVNLFVSVHAMLSGLMNPLGWGIVAIYLFFTIGFGYFLVRKPVDI